MTSDRISAYLQRWVAMVAGHPWRTLLLLALATTAIGYNALTSFNIDSDNAGLIKQEGQWRDDYETFKDEFPHLVRASLVVVSGDNQGRVNDVTKELRQSLSGDVRFESVFAPAAMDFFRDNGLLYMQPDELDRFLSQLAEMQPFLTRLAEDPTLPGLFTILEDGLENADDEPLPEGFGEFASLIADTADSLVQGQPEPADWRAGLQPESSAPYYSLLTVKGNQDFSRTQPNRAVVESLNQHIDRLRPLPSDTEVRLTGRIPLDYQEMQEAIQGAQLAGTVSLVLLAIILTFGMRSIVVILAIYLSIFTGLVWTTSFAGLTVGSFSTISVVFLIMFIGLGVDFAIHYCLRYQENLDVRSSQPEALQLAAGRTGKPIALCAVSSALGFLAFTPTDYIGLAELGIISAGGMAIALFLSFTLIPAVLALGRAPRPLTVSGQGYAAALQGLSRHRAAFVVLMLTVTAGATWVSLGMSFNFSTLAMRNPDSEAMATLRELHDRDIMTSFAISVMAPDSETAKKHAQRLAPLDSVSKVRLPRDHVPANQEEKLAILDDAVFFLHPLLEAQYQPRNATPGERIQAADSLIGSLESVLDDPPDSLSSDQRRPLRDLLDKLKTIRERPGRDELLANLETLLVDDMEVELSNLQRALRPDAVKFAELPDKVRERLISDSGKHHVMVLPSRDITELEALRDFVREVRGEAGNATGRPVLEYSVGEVVVGAFQQALVFAIAAISVVLLIALRSILDTLLVFVPLLMAIACTFAVAVLINEPLNMANIIVLPLIFGLGVDNAIHVIRRYREEPDVRSMLRSSTPRAVLLSALTTLGTFGALTLSPHQGMYSIGLLLTIAIGFQLLFTLLFLPTLLEFVPKRPGVKQPPPG